MIPRFILLAAISLTTSLAVAQQAPSDVVDKVMIDLFRRQGQGGATLCMLKGSTRESIHAALAPLLIGVDINNDESATAIAGAVYTEFPCPFSPDRPELRRAKTDEIVGDWLFPESSQRLRHGPNSPAWKVQPGMTQVKCEGVSYFADGALLVAQVRGNLACPTSKFMAGLASHPRVEHWSIAREGRIKTDRTDVAGYVEEWDIFVVQTGFDFAGIQFSPGDLTAYRRREPDNEVGATTLFRHLQRLR